MKLYLALLDECDEILFGINYIAEATELKMTHPNLFLLSQPRNMDSDSRWYLWSVSEQYGSQ